MARTEVTREINKYIRTNNLQDKENGRKINPDKKLTSLLKLKKGDELTYFNLQRYMSPHFAKSAAAQAAAAAAAAPVAASS
jgi:chromatin remodeling complex protein RSC6